LLRVVFDVVERELISKRVGSLVDRVREDSQENENAQHGDASGYAAPQPNLPQDFDEGIHNDRKLGGEDEGDTEGAREKTKS
jgi:hypothetical protein